MLFLFTLKPDLTPFFRFMPCILAALLKSLKRFSKERKSPIPPKIKDLF